MINVRSCRVTISDMDGVAHTVEVSAATLYEAVALGLAAIRNAAWTGEIGQGLHAVKVAVMDVSVEHTVMFVDFNKWLQRDSGSPREMSQRERIRIMREIGVPKFTTSNPVSYLVGIQSASAGDLNLNAVWFADIILELIKK